MEVKPTQKSEVRPLGELLTKLSNVEKRSKAILDETLRDAGVSMSVAEQYANLFPESTDKQTKKATRFSLNILKNDPFLTLVISGFLLKAGIRVATESEGNLKKAAIIILDSAVHWAGESVTSPENLAFLTAIAGTALYLGAPAKIVDLIGQRTAGRVKRDAEAMRIRSEKEQEIREGKADFDGKVGPNVQIDVGISDPAMKDLLTLLHAGGLRVVSYWDDKNQFFNIDPAWQKTSNDWTNRETLKRGDVREALCSVILVSNGDDIFLSTRKQDPSKQMQDITDNEAIGTIHARDAVRGEMGLPPIQHILVSNPQRTIEIGIARVGETPYKPKTVGKVVSELPNVHLIDPDLLTIHEIAEIANKQDLPIELITSEERKDEYSKNLVKVMERYNQLVDSGLEKNRVRLATEEDGKNTLSLIYGSTDEDTIAQVTTYEKEFSETGDLVAIINDPEKISRLPQGAKYICIGRSVAEAVYQKFFELVTNGSINLQAQPET